MKCNQGDFVVSQKCIFSLMPEIVWDVPWSQLRMMHHDKPKGGRLVLVWEKRCSASELLFWTIHPGSTNQLNFLEVELTEKIWKRLLPAYPLLLHRNYQITQESMQWQFRKSWLRSTWNWSGCFLVPRKMRPMCLVNTLYVGTCSFASWKTFCSQLHQFLSAKEQT